MQQIWRGDACRYDLAGLGVGRELGRNAVRDVNQPTGVNEVILNDFRANGDRRMEDDGRALEAARMRRAMARNQRGARIALRLKQAAKGIEIVAKNSGSARRQSMNEMGIAMIDDVKQVKLTDVVLRKRG